VETKGADINRPWRDRHPFPLGSTVIAKSAHELFNAEVIEAGRSYLVRMRGEDANGLWVAVEGVLTRLPISFFDATDPNSVTEVA
jgi:hypothetical protein